LIIYSDNLFAGICQVLIYECYFLIGLRFFIDLPIATCYFLATK